MGRPPLPLGTYGKIGCVKIADGQYRARCKFRDYDGQVRPVERVGRTKTAAENNLRAAVRDRQGPTEGLITRETRLRDVGATWLAEVQASDLSIGTKQTYKTVLNSYVLPAVGSIQVGEATVGPMDRALRAIRAQRGAGAARSARSVLSGMLALAARHDAIAANPVRETSKISGKAKPKVRSLTVEQTKYVIESVRASDRANALDLPDLIEWMLYTGCRIGEACAVRYEDNPEGKPLLDLDAGTWEVDATIVREDGVGLFIQERTKTDAGWRVLALPPSAVEMMERRRARATLQGPRGIVFSSPRARSLRDHSNTPGDIREVLDAIDCDVCGRTGRIPLGGGKFKPCSEGPFSWVHSHIFRKTVATRMDEAGCTAREIADQLGHSKPSMTQDVYMGRNVVSARAAEVLNR